jgi:hypothetical protein
MAELRSKQNTTIGLTDSRAAANSEWKRREPIGQKAPASAALNGDTHLASVNRQMAMVALHAHELIGALLGRKQQDRMGGSHVQPVDRMPKGVAGV